MKLNLRFRVLRYLSVLLFVSLAISCNTIGETMEEQVLEANLVQSFEDVNLEKGDVVVLWVNAKLNYKNQYPVFQLKYNIENSNETVFYEKFDLYGAMIANVNPRIRSSKDDTDTFMEYNNGGEKSEKNYTKWNFQMELNKFEVPEDGYYTFDFKLYKDDAEFISDEIEVVLRKL